jgi:dGTPase
VYLGPAARRESARVQRMLRALVDHYVASPADLQDGAPDPGADPLQRITDWVAGMTDRYCITTFKALCVPEESRI